MAKKLLWIFVIGNSLSLMLMYFYDVKSEWINVVPMLVAIGVLAICESIEKTKEVN